MDWSSHYPAFFTGKGNAGKDGARVEFADIGCGYGGLTGKQITALKSMYLKSSIAQSIWFDSYILSPSLPLSSTDQNCTEIALVNTNH